MNKILLLSCLSITMVSCSFFKHSAGKKPPAQASPKQGESSSAATENTSISGSPTPGKVSKVQTTAPVSRDDSMENYNVVEKINNSQFKYAILLDAPVEEMLNQKLIEFLEGWYGIRYRLGGTDKTGVDCSAFVQVFMASMYALSLPRTSVEQFRGSQRISKKELQEGDLVFFRTQRKKKISHVGVYLRNNKFVHASTTSGVMISDLNEAYFSSKFAGAGRVSPPVGQGTSN